MNTKILIPALLAALLSGCAASGTAPAGDAVHQQAIAEMERARADGSFPLTEKQFTYPDWPGLAQARPANAP